jgi:hypothetical protein
MTIAPLSPSHFHSNRPFSERAKIEAWRAEIRRANNFNELFHILKAIPEANIPLKEWHAILHVTLKDQLSYINVGQFKEIFLWMQEAVNNTITQKVEHPDNVTPFYFLFEQLEESLEDKKIRHHFGDDQFTENCLFPLEERLGDLHAAGLVHT